MSQTNNDRAPPRRRWPTRAQWEAIAEDVPASLSLTGPVEERLDGKVLALDATWRQMAARLEETDEGALVSAVGPAGGGRAGRQRLEGRAAS